jgi:glycosyltransferase involved in cell wall biosynthesis
MVSVIIPYYNCAAWIGKTLDSCLQQGGSLHEIIVVDDFSTDGGWEILCDYQRRWPDLIKPKKNSKKGGNNARNYGFDLSTGDYIQWLDADDQLLPGKFSTQIKAFAAAPEADIVYSDWQLDTYDRSGVITRREWKHHRQYQDFIYELLVNNWSPPLNYLVKREMAAKLGKIEAWNPATPFLQDREYFTLAAIHGARFRYAEGNFSVYNRWSSGSVSQKKAGYDETLSILLDNFARRIEDRSDIEPQKKVLYKKIMSTERLLSRMKGKKVLYRDHDLKFKNIYWPLIGSASTRIKMLSALLLNLI